MSLTSPEPPVAFGDGLNPNVNPANGPGLVVTPEFIIAADQQAVSHHREGVVHVWRKVDSTWTYWQTLIDHGPNAATNHGWFGYTLDLSQGWLAIGSTNSAGPYGQGDVQMFKLNESTRQFEFAQYLQAPEVGVGDEFGDTLALDGNWLIIGAPWHNHQGVSDTGAVWFYELENGTTWVQRQKLIGDNTDATDWFGIAVELRGDEAFVSSMFDNWGGYGSGTVYLFKLQNGIWGQTGRLKPTIPRGGESFGACIQCEGDTLVITAPMRNSSTLIGSVYFFERQAVGWQQSGSYIPDNVAAGENFGTSLALAGNLAAAGTKYGEAKRGLVHIFRKNPASAQWAFVQVLAPEERAAGDLFGADVFTDGLHLHVVAPGAYVGGLKRNLLYSYVPEVPGHVEIWPDPANDQPPAFSSVAVTCSPAIPTVSLQLSVAPTQGAILQYSHNLIEWFQVSDPIPPGNFLAEYPRFDAGFFRLNHEP